MKNLKYLFLLFPILAFSQTQSIPWPSFVGNGAGYGNNCVLTKSGSMLTLTFSCGFNSTVVANHEVAVITAFTIADVSLGMIPNREKATSCSLYIQNNRLYINNGTNGAVTAFNGTINLQFANPGAVPYVTMSAVGENYIQSTDYLTDTEAGAKNINKTFYDGLGKPKQTVLIGQAASGNNIVIPMDYDVYGRQEKEYLPYSVPSSSSADYYASATTDVASYNLYTGQTPYSQKKFDDSPLDRVLKQAAPGNDWALGSGHEIKMEYKTNAANEVKFYKVTFTGSVANLVLSAETFYQANQLYKNVIYDENTAASPVETSGSMIEYKNKKGQVVLKRTYSTVGTGTALVVHDTYYVYDIYGNLSFVIPPKADGTIDATALSNLCYQYKYDSRNRLIEKKLPGKAWEYIVYDKLNRVVATGPVFFPFGMSGGYYNGWLVTKYDCFDRPAYTAWYNGTEASSLGRGYLQNDVNTAGQLSEARIAETPIGVVPVAYSNVTMPNQYLHVLSINYYDNYNFPNAPVLPSAIEGQTPMANVKELPTGSWVRALTNEAESAGNSSYVIYDYKRRPIRNYTANYLQGYTRVDTKYDFSKANYTITAQKRDNIQGEITVKNVYFYTTQNRLSYQNQSINGGPEKFLFNNIYNEIGQVQYKNVGNQIYSPLQKVDYKYNIRGWLTSVNNDLNDNLALTGTDLFAYKINYNTTAGSVAGVSPLYNGNISETYWRSANDNTLRKYGYEYDKLNRLRKATYQKPDVGNVPDSYGESATYDKNGNIMSMLRKGEYDDLVYTLTTDNLTYAYDENNANLSNQLYRVSDSSGISKGFDDGTNTDNDFAYDINGNMISDKNKRITSISYNHLNLPVKIVFSSNESRKIEYLYDGLGQKLRKTITSAGSVETVDYLSGFQYTNTVLEFFPFDGGYVKNTVDGSGNNVYNYVFNYEDHLGNVRLSYTADPTNPAKAVVLEENNYYPFGLKHRNYNMSQYNYAKTQGGGVTVLPGASGYKYKYNGKEWQDEMGLNMYDYGARNYDPAIGRWMNVDPLAELSRRFSPYTYALNNPVYFIDPDGMSAVGADGLTNEQWVNAGGDSAAEDSYRNANKQSEIDENRSINAIEKKNFKTKGDRKIITNADNLLNNVDDNALRMWSHANQYYLEVYGKDGAIVQLDSPELLNDYLDSSPMQKAWTFIKLNGGTFISYGCDAGDIGGILHMMSSIFKKPVFIGADNYVYPSLGLDGKVYSGKNKSENGRWNIFHDGELLDSKPWNWQPTEIDPKTKKPPVRPSNIQKFLNMFKY